MVRRAGEGLKEPLDASRTRPIVMGKLGGGEFGYKLNNPKVN